MSYCGTGSEMIQKKSIKGNECQGIDEEPVPK
jgi:hypothetical protein